MLLAMKTCNVTGPFFDLSIVTVKQSFIVGQIVSCSVILSLVLLDSVNNTCYVIHVTESQLI